MTLSLILTGHIPSKKNSKQIFFNKGTGRPFITSSEVSKQWHKDASFEVMSWRNRLTAGERNNLPFRSAKVKIVIYSKTSLANDLTNKAESIMDLLVDTGILKDDNWSVVSSILLEYGGADRSNPRAEVTIEKL